VEVQNRAGKKKMIFMKTVLLRDYNNSFIAFIYCGFHYCMMMMIMIIIIIYSPLPTSHVSS